MYQEERLTAIAELLNRKRTLSNQEVMETFGISRDTARRDIVRLVEMGIATRTHGGITTNGLNLEIMSYKERIAENRGEKERLAESAVRFLKEKQICFFDVSTTVEILCGKIPYPVEGYTNSLRNLTALQTTACGIHLLGGKLNRDNQFLYGSETLEQVERIHFDLAFLGAAAVHEDGIYVEDEEDAGVKRKVIQNCDMVCVLADHLKFYKRSKFQAARLNQIHALITDVPPPDQIAEKIHEAGMKLEICNERKI
jgi:Transcriptional regulators of sugar metabolism